MTGKTETLLSYLQQELKHVAPNRIAFLTFTRAAKAVALQRAQKPQDELPFVRTIHATCYRALGMDQQRMVRRSDLLKFGDVIGERVTGAIADPWIQEEFGHTWEKPTRHDELLRLNHLGRHRQILLKAALEGYDFEWRYARWFTESYRSWKKHEELFDYTDLLTEYLENGRPLDVDVMIVDEAQDLSELQWRVVEKLGVNADRRYVAGDDLQCIYSWAGASAEKLINLPVDKVQVLGQSYRVPRAVHEVALDIEKRVKVKDPERAYAPRDANGFVGELGEITDEEVGGNTNSDNHTTLILFRNHMRGPQLLKRLENLDVAVSGPGCVLSDVGVSAALRAWWKLHHKTKIDVVEARGLMSYAARDALRTKALPKNAVDLTLENLIKENNVVFAEWPRVLGKLPKLRYLERVAQRQGFERLLLPRVKLMSAHQAKGREEDVVILDPVMATKTWKGFMREPDDEHRVMYVAVTRAREKLYVLTADDPKRYQVL